MVKIILATSNPHKLEEINAINKNADIIFDVVKGNFDPDETGKTFEENAIIKAKEAARLTGEYCLADDSGLCIDCLDGAPGIYSARYANTPQSRINRVLKELEGIPSDKRSAHFNCSMVLVNPNGDVIHTETGKVFGYIDDEPKGNNGFGYDPIFYLPEYGKTMAELPETEKNSISHRANALCPMINWINDNL